MESAVQQVCEEFWAWRMKNFPVFASFCGIHEYDDRLEAVTEDAILAQQADCRALLAKVESAGEGKGLSSDDQLTARLLAEDLRCFIEGVDSKGYLFPINFMEGVHVDFHNVISWSKLETEQDFRKYLCRLSALAIQTREVEEVLKQAVSRGVTNSKHSMKGVGGQLEAYEKPARDTFVFKPLLKLPDSLSQGVRRELEEGAEKIIESEVKPAMLSLKNYILQAYMPACRPVDGVMSLPGGDEFYRKCLQFHLSVDMTAQEVYDLGLREVARINSEQEKVKQDVGFTGSLQDFLLSVKQDQRFLFKDKADVLPYFEDLCFNKIRSQLPKVVKKMPKCPMVLAEVPETLKTSPVGFYLAGTSDGTRPGTYYINSWDLSILPKYELMALSLHEGEPGHHLQSMYASEQAEMPKFRRTVQDHAYYTAPSRFPLHTAYGEGWGLYCEGLGEVMGLYSDPYDRLGRLSFEMHRALRLVVDPGLHALGWDRDRAVNYMCDNTAIPRGFVENEVDRYITWPGQACAYKVGELKLLEMRRAAEEKFGRKFDITEFNDVILRAGPMPLSMLQKCVDQYITEAVSSNGA